MTVVLLVVKMTFNDLQRCVLASVTNDDISLPLNMQVVLKEKLKKQIKFTDLNAKKELSTDIEACAYWNICKENQRIDLQNRVVGRYVMSKTDFNYFYTSPVKLIYLRKSSKLHFQPLKIGYR